MDAHSFELWTAAIWQRWSLVAVLIGTYFAVRRLRQYRRLQDFRGPPTTGVSNWWHSRAILSGQAHLYYAEATAKYGPIARIAPNHLITSSPEVWRRINAARSPYHRAPWYYHAARFEPGKDNVFTECDNDRHDTRRKKMAAGYSGKENPTLEPSIDTHVRELIVLVRKYASPASSTAATTPMDLARKISFFTLDVISHVGLGRAFGDLVADHDQMDYLRSTEEGLRIGNTALALGIAWLKDAPLIGPLISPSERDPSGYGRMMAEARQIVRERIKAMQDDKDDDNDMLASFARHGVPEDDLFQEAFEQILAGSDTTSAAICITLLFIFTHPRVYHRLRDEIDAACSSLSDEHIIADTTARTLPYLRAVVREALRIHPPVLNIFSRITPPEGDIVTVDGKEYHIPGGSMIGPAIWAMHRNNTFIYGADATVFRPERWLLDESNADEAAQLNEMNRQTDLIFGHGRWQCLGRRVAELEMHKSVFELLRRFDFALTNPHDPWHVHNSLGLWEIRDMWVDVTFRE